MTGVTQAEKQEGQGPDGDRGQSMVQIVVNGTEYAIHRGRQTVAAIKAVAQVPAAHELALLEGEQELTRLPDDGSLVIKGGERFLSYPKDAASS